MKLLLKRNNKGFTQIERWIVMLVWAIVMAGALPVYLAAVTDSQLKTCRANMQTISNAEAAFKTSDPTHVYTTTLSSLNPNLGALPVCHSGGTYAVVLSTGSTTANNGGAVPSGGLVVSRYGRTPTHGVFAPGIDSQ